MARNYIGWYRYRLTTAAGKWRNELLNRLRRQATDPPYRRAEATVDGWQRRWLTADNGGWS